MVGLQFNDTSAAVQGLIQSCEDDLNFPVGGISGNTALLNQFTRRINKWYQKVVTMIFASQDRWNWDDSNQTNYPVATTNLVAGQQDYPIPISLNLVTIQRVDVLLDGVTLNRGIPIDRQSIRGQDISANFSVNSPTYELKANSIWLRPTPLLNVTAGLILNFTRGPLEFTSSDTTKQPGIDVAFHAMISTGASYDFAKIKNLPQASALLGELQDYEARLKLQYGRKDDDTKWAFSSSIPDYDEGTYGQPGSYN
jgi:hypothetical protein